MPKRPSYLEIIEADNDRLRQRVAELESEVARLSASPEVYMASPSPKFRLTPTEALVFARIVATGFATKRDLLAIVSLGKEKPPEEKIVDVYVCKIRAKLEPFDIVIETAHGRGYKISPENRAIVAAMQAGTQLARAS